MYENITKILITFGAISSIVAATTISISCG
ncbi:variable surface lipoprotein [Mycoplasma sp. 1232]